MENFSYFFLAEPLGHLLSRCELNKNGGILEAGDVVVDFFSLKLFIIYPNNKIGYAFGIFRRRLLIFKLFEFYSSDFFSFKILSDRNDFALGKGLQQNLIFIDKVGVLFDWSSSFDVDF